MKQKSYKSNLPEIQSAAYWSSTELIPVKISMVFDTEHIEVQLNVQFVDFTLALLSDNIPIIRTKNHLQEISVFFSIKNNK